ncbi:MAG: DUF3786 domain-containing protein [Desulfobulbaceae bacterium]|nr:DUF3786 domain-containing protein [Desulfobulbaceae bacterium]
MTINALDLYRDVLPKTNCGDCSFPTCLAFAGMVISERIPLKDCPHVDPDLLIVYEQKINEQYCAGNGFKKEIGREALAWAKEKAKILAYDELAARVGGELVYKGDDTVIKLPYFNDSLTVSKSGIAKKDGSEPTILDQVFIYNHLVHAGSPKPTGEWKGFIEFPNTISKIKSMKDRVETPLVECFWDHPDRLRAAAETLGGVDLTDDLQPADMVFLFKPLPKVPVMLLFWDADEDEDFDAEAKLRFDETIVQHLDIESIVFLSERLRELLCEM